MAQATSSATSVLISFGISFINFVIRILVISLIKKIGFNQESQVTAEIVSTIFVSQFINTGLMLVITNAKIRFQYLPSVFRGSYTDFTDQWYVQVGSQLTQTMLVAAFMPYITFVIAYSIKSCSRCFDRCNLPNGYKTKRVTIQQYITMYSGPDVVIHFRYANIMNQIFVSFTHGLAIPLLFPIALLGIVNMYIVERLQFAYFYK